MLRRINYIVREQGWQLENIDATVVAQWPRLSPHTPAMKAVIASLLQIDPDRISIKSKTTDGLGFTGTGEGIAAYCVALLVRDEQNAKRE
jgi:2-C-methyl-D-erythritol 2,4-cyclodiphosphate synthase